MDSLDSTLMVHETIKSDFQTSKLVPGIFYTRKVLTIKYEESVYFLESEEFEASIVLLSFTFISLIFLSQWELSIWQFIEANSSE